MTLLDQTEVLMQFADLEAHRVKRPQKAAQQRSSGLHLSTILKYLYFGSLPPVVKSSKDQLKGAMQQASEELESPFDPTVMPLRMVLGMAFESFVVGFYPKLIWQPKELLRDGVSGSPDGYNGDPPAEFKLTWKSSRERLGENILKESLWMWQIKGYLAMRKSYRATAELHACFVNGDYRHPYQPRYYKFTIGFDEEELEGFWERAIMPNREKAQQWAGRQVPGWG